MYDTLLCVHYSMAFHHHGVVVVQIKHSYILYNFERLPPLVVIIRNSRLPHNSMEFDTLLKTLWLILNSSAHVLLATHRFDPSCEPNLNEVLNQENIHCCYVLSFTCIYL